VFAAAARLAGAARFAGAAGRGEGRLAAAAGRAAREDDADFEDGFVAGFGAGFFGGFGAGAAGFTALGVVATGFAIACGFAALVGFEPLAADFVPSAGFALAAGLGTLVGFAAAAATTGAAGGAGLGAGEGKGFVAGAAGTAGAAATGAAAAAGGFAIACGFAAAGPGVGAEAEAAVGLEATGFVISGRIFAMAARSAAFSAAFLSAITRGSTDWCTMVTRGVSGLNAEGLAGSALADERLPDLPPPVSAVALPAVSPSATRSIRLGRSSLSTFSRSSSVVSSVGERTTFAKRTISPMEWYVHNSATSMACSVDRRRVVSSELVGTNRISGILDFANVFH
jgi:hypothetical protein